MKILLIDLRYRGGGAARCARELFERLPEVGVETEMWVAERGPDDPPGVVGMRQPWERRLALLEAVPHLTDWRHVGSRRRLDGLRPGDFDVVHLHTAHSGCASIKALHRLCERMPVVWTLHDQWAVTGGNCVYLEGVISRSEVKRLTSGPMRYLPYHPYHDNFRLRGLRKMLARWLPQPRVVITPSQFMYRQAVESGRFPHATIHQRIHGVTLLETRETQIDRPEARKAFGLDIERPVVLLVAANLTDAHKGAMLGIEAIRRLPDDVTPQVFLLGHSGTTIAPLLPQHCVHVAFAKDNAKLAMAYRAADLTLIPSLGESLSYVALESLSCQTPFVGFDVGGLPEIAGAGERGLLAPRFDTHILGNHLTRLLRDPILRDSLGRQGRQWVAANCDMASYLRSIKSLYDAALTARSYNGSSGPTARLFPSFLL